MPKQEEGLWAQLSALDAFPKVNEDFFKKTMSGGVITILASVLMALLFVSELRLYLTTQTTHELIVDTSRGAHIDINFDVTFPHMPCAWLSLDAMDISGEMHLDVATHDVKKQRLGANGAPVSQVEQHDVKQTQKSNDSTLTGCGSCYGAESEALKCCNTCEDVRQAYTSKGWVLNNVNHIEQCKDDKYLQSINEQAGEGCHVWGHLSVNKVAGNFHFAAGHSYQSGSMHIHDMAPFAEKTLDFTHKIHSLSFGKQYPGMRNPLDGVMQVAPNKKSSETAAQSKKATGMYQYFLKVVPTDYIDRNNVSTRSNQFSVTENFRESTDALVGGRSLPGVFFFYDLSPIKVHIQEQKSSFLHFMTNVCAIVGGIFAVSGLVDGTVYQAAQVIKKKIDLGKHI